MSIYRKKLVLTSRDVNMHRRLRTSRLFEFMQESAIRHTEQLGAGRALTLDKGILWVVTMQQARIARMPEYDEEVLLESWPGETMHVLFPRYFRVLDASGQCLVTASALWTLVDRDSRKLVFPENCGVNIPGEVTGFETPLPSPVPRPEADRHHEFTVPFSYVDLNGHMNNTRYYDLVEDLCPAAARGETPTLVSAEYSGELRLGDTVRVDWREDGEEYTFCGVAGKDAFRIRMEFKPGENRENNFESIV